jgi:poly(U)-specific endoribonuclease
MDIYQEIWDEDQKHCGLKAIKKGDPIDAATKDHGYVIVDEKEVTDKDHKVIVEVHIPPSKIKSYDLVEVLFNNYVLDQTKPEVDTLEDLKTEQQEIQSFIEYAYKTPPMQKARKYYSEQTKKEVTDDEWWAIIERVWFAQFDSGKNQDLSGFEHVIVGEQKQGKVQGYHFWYKYYLDEHFVPDTFSSLNNPAGSVKDTIHFLGWEGKRNLSPDCVTLSFVWEAFDYKAKQYRKLTKPIGGFWVGPSVEGLMAIGTVRFLEQAFAPKKATINDVTYNLILFRSPNDKHLRTFYPEDK